MTMDRLISENLDELASRVLKRVALKEFLTQFKEIEQSLILGVEQLERESDIAENYKRFRLGKAQCKIKLIRNNIDASEKALAALDKELAAFAVV